MASRAVKAQKLSAEGYLRSVGLEDEDAATPAMVQAALDAQDRMISELAKIIEDGMH